jgi:hypothetical protein
MHADDPFARAYLRWLGHHEFGLGHRPFAFATAAMGGLKPEQPDYWLTYWIAVYDHLLGIACHPQVITVSHDLLCAQPIQGLAGLFKGLGIHGDAAEFAQKLWARPSDASAFQRKFSLDIVSQSNSIRDQWMRHAMKLVDK